VEQTKCGCLLPDQSGELQVGETLTSPDCTKIYTCSAANEPVSVEEQKCDDNAECVADKDGILNCKCSEGYFGDGLKCTQGKKKTKTFINKIKSKINKTIHMK
jgi:hypothetical protein